MAEGLSDKDLADIEARCQQVAAVSAKVGRASTMRAPHVTPASLSLWIDELCNADVPRLLAEVRRLRAELAYLRGLREDAGDDEAAYLRAALRRIATATWEVWRGDAAARGMAQEARWALGEQDQAP